MPLRLGLLCRLYHCEAAKVLLTTKAIQTDSTFRAKALRACAMLRTDISVYFGEVYSVYFRVSKHCLLDVCVRVLPKIVYLNFPRYSLLSCEIPENKQTIGVFSFSIIGTTVKFPPVVILDQQRMARTEPLRVTVCN